MARRFVQSLQHAFRGIMHAFHTQRNLRIHIIIGAVVFGLGFYFQLTHCEFAALMFAIFLVEICEMINTSIEEAINLVSPTRSMPAMVAKDVAAGAVLLSGICAIIIGCLIFIPHLVGR